jgi:hypothetical protein
MLLFGHRYEDAKLLQSHGVLLHQFDQREAEARDKQQRERTEPGRPKAPRRQEQPVETECYALLAQAAVPTMLWNAIPSHGQHHRIEHRHARQLSGGKRRSRDNPIQEQARQNFVTVPAGRWMIEGRPAPDLPSSDLASLVLEITIMGWLHRPSNPMSVIAIDQPNR